METQPKPAPEPDEISLPYWEAAQRGQLMVQKCASCGRGQFPPEPICRHCQAADPPFVEMSGTGTIYTFAVYGRSFSPAFEVPYALALVTLDEDPGVRLMTNIVDSDLDQLAVGDPVKVTYEQRGEWSLPQFRVAGGVAR